MPCLPAWSTCPRGNVPKACQLLIFTCQCANNVSTCQRRANFSIWRANVPKGVLIFRIYLSKGVAIFQLFFKRIFQSLNFSIMLNVCKFQEYLGNSRKFISQNKEFKSSHLQNFIKEIAKLILSSSSSSNF